MPENSELPLITFSALTTAGIDINRVEELFDYDILKQGTKFTAVDELTLDYLKDHPKQEVVKGTLILLKNTTPEDLAHVAALPGVTIDCTAVAHKTKECLTSVLGNLIDNSEHVNYPQLQSVAGNAYFLYLTTAEGLTALTTIGGDTYFYELTTAEGLTALTKNGGNAQFPKLTTAERAKIPALNK